LSSIIGRIPKRILFQGRILGIILPKNIGGILGRIIGGIPKRILFLGFLQPPPLLAIAVATYYIPRRSPREFSHAVFLHMASKHKTPTGGAVGDSLSPLLPPLAAVRRQSEHAAPPQPGAHGLAGT
jgi:hypothetical protein